MDEIITRLARLTDSCVQRLNEMTEDDFEQFVGEREEIVEAMKSIAVVDRDKYRSAMDRILQHDALIRSQMQALMDDAQASLGKLAAGRRQQSAYASGYSSDSYFVDKKK